MKTPPLYLDVELALRLHRGTEECLAMGSRDARLDVGTHTLTQFGNPWAFARQDERYNRSYALGRAALRRTLQALPPTLRDGLLHDWIYFFAEDLVAGVFLAQAVMASQGTNRPTVVGNAHRFDHRVAMQVLKQGGWSIHADAGSPAGHSGSAGAQAPASTPLQRADVLVVELYPNRLRHLWPVTDPIEAAGGGVHVLNLNPRAGEAAALSAECERTRHSVTWWKQAFDAALIARVGRRVAQGTQAGRWLALDLPAAVADQLDVRLPPRWASAAMAQWARSSVRMGTIHAVLEHSISRVKPAAVLTARSDDTILRILGPVAHAAGVPVVDVQHGIRNGAPSAVLRDVRHVDLALAGSTTADRYLDAGTDPDYVHRTGTTFFDFLASARTVARPDGLPERFVVYSSAVVRIHKRMIPDIAHRRVLAGLDQALDHDPTLHVIIRPHPQEDENEARTTAATLRNAARVQVRTDISNSVLFRHGLAQVSVGSTTTLEAALLGTPAYLMTEGDISRSFDAGIEVGGFVRVDSAEALAAAFSELSASRMPEAVCAQINALYADGIDGRAAERILAIPRLDHALQSRLGGTVR